MRKNQPKTPLLAVLRHLGTGPKRLEFATAAGTSVGYLYQLAGCYEGRQGCRPELARRIADASVKMHKRYKSPVLTVEQVTAMCRECGS